MDPDLGEALRLQHRPVDRRLETLVYPCHRLMAKMLFSSQRGDSSLWDFPILHETPDAKTDGNLPRNEREIVDNHKENQHHD